jgi:hypothetical protein
MDRSIKKYLASIGSKGGKKSRRKLDPKTAREMVRLREARRAYRKYQARCFWSFDPDYVIKPEDIEWVAEQLMKNGGREAWQVGARLCR